MGFLLVVDTALAKLKTPLRSSCGLAITWTLTTSPIRLAAAAPASSARRPNIAEIYFPVTLLLIGALLGSLYWITHRYVSANGVSRPESETPARTGFSANRDGAAWKLTWDSAAVEALKPTGATLSIQDGAGEQDIPLTTADLFSGTVYYTPKGGDLAFRFEVRRGLATVGEGRVRVVEGIKQVPVSSPANPIRQTVPAVVSAQRRKQRRRRAHLHSAEIEFPASGFRSDINEGCAARRSADARAFAAAPRLQGSPRARPCGARPFAASHATAGAAGYARRCPSGLRDSI